MATGTLTIDLDALVANWQSLDRLSGPSCGTGAVVKADGYGLGAGRVAAALARAGARSFFVAVAEEGAAVRRAVGPDPDIFVFSGHMPGDTDTIADMGLTPLLNSAAQATRHFETLPRHAFGVQLDTGMNRLGMEPAEWDAIAPHLLAAGPRLVMSHLACADEPGHPLNAAQLAEFLRMTDGIEAPRSLAATGGVLLGPEYHFDLVRPGVGLFGGLPFEAAQPVVRLSLPVVQAREVTVGEAVGYGCSWTAETPARIATVSGGYADGLIRFLSNRAVLWAGDVPCPLAGRVSMDLITVDVTHLSEVPPTLDILGPHQTVDELASAAGTIGYEILTSLGKRYDRRYTGGGA